MSGASALKKINARVKKLAKKYPGKKRTTLQKQAGAEYRAGKLKAKRPRKKVKAKKVSHRKKRRVARVAKVGTHRAPVKRTRRRKAKRTKSAKVRIRTVTRTVRIGSRKKSMLPVILGVAALGLGAMLLMKKSAPAVLQTQNPIRNQQTNSIIQYATAAGVVGDALTKLINAINASNDTSINTLATQAAQTPSDTGIYNPDLNPVFIAGTSSNKGGWPGGYGPR